MDTKLKNNKKGWSFLLGTLAVALLASAWLTFGQYDSLLQNDIPDEETYFSTYEFQSYLREYSEALYYGVNREGKEGLLPSELLLRYPSSTCTLPRCQEASYLEEETGLNEYIGMALNELSFNPNIAYYAKEQNSGNVLTNMEPDAQLQAGEIPTEIWAERYQYWVQLRFDAAGVVEIVTLEGAVQTYLQDQLQSYSDRANWYFSQEDLKPLANFEVTFAVPKKIAQYESFGNSWYWHNNGYITGRLLLIAGSICVLLAVVGMFIPQKVGQTKFGGAILSIPLEVWGIIAVGALFASYALMSTLGIVLQTLSKVDMQLLAVMHFVGWFAVFGIALLLGWIVKHLLFHPLQYLRNHTLVMMGVHKVKRSLQNLFEAFDQAKALGKYNSLLLKVVILNAVVVAALVVFWFFGLLGVVLYSVALYLLLIQGVTRYKRHYEGLLRNTTQVAQGKFDGMENQNLGIFQPIQDELATIQVGFKQAVEQEIKSQRMKTELITNVSHDLKTPLTAIVTYTDLLKDSPLDAQQQEYVAILERKAKRLQVLIEDLFEMSKASSGTMSLQCSEVDVVSLMKQTLIELEEDFANAQLQVRESFPQEKVMVNLDPQRTYRIFENLLVNITKYALANSRVYLEIKPLEECVQISFKNVTFEEITFQPDEIVERFVRGDQARNTEGSGLGLAIAKSFTELQKGSMDVVVDGDLFKVVLTFPLETNQP
ncbi:MAG: histidine kinase dimerization/phospho-acceptor domain-containing protein [Erysipelotrichaceae bacterium]